MDGSDDNDNSNSNSNASSSKTNARSGNGRPPLPKMAPVSNNINNNNNNNSEGNSNTPPPPSKSHRPADSVGTESSFGNDNFLRQLRQANHDAMENLPEWNEYSSASFQTASVGPPPDPDANALHNNNNSNNNSGKPASDIIDYRTRIDQPGVQHSNSVTSPKSTGDIGRDRTVSWDASVRHNGPSGQAAVAAATANATATATSTAPSSTSNVNSLKDINLPQMPQPGVVDTDRLAQQQEHLNRMKSRRRINLSDVIGANYELEAETLLLQTIDQTNINTSPDEWEDLNQQAVLSNVPASVSHGLRQTSIGTNFSNLSDPGDQQRPTDGYADNNRNNDDDDHDDYANSTAMRRSYSRSNTPGSVCVPKPSSYVAPSPPSPRTGDGSLSGRSNHNHQPHPSNQATSGSNSAAAAVRVPAPSSRSPPVPSTAASDMSHRRQMTVEEKIFGLTNALNAMDTLNTSGNPIEQDIPPAHNDSSGDRLFNTVNLLFKRRRAKTEDSTGINDTALTASAAQPQTTSGAPDHDSSVRNGSSNNNNNNNDPSGGPRPTSPTESTATPGPLKNATERWAYLRDHIETHKKLDHIPDAATSGSSQVNSEEQTSFSDPAAANPAIADSHPNITDVEQGKNGNSNDNKDDDIAGGSAAVATGGSNGEPGKVTAPRPGGRTASGRMSNSQGSNSEMRRSSRYNPFLYLPFGDRIKEEWDLVNEFLEPRQASIYFYIRVMVFYLMAPLIGIAFILFYFLDNPPTGRDPEDRDDTASSSWWLLFIVRNMITFSMAKFMELIIIDYFCLNTRFIVDIFGPVVTLLIASSKGWPFILTFWALFDFFLLVGTHPFAEHWLYFQSFLRIFNENNPAGNVTVSEPFYTSLIIAIVVGVIVSVKRVLVGLYLGRKTFSNFADSLSQVLDKMLLITEVAVLARDIEKRVWIKEVYGSDGIGGLVQMHQPTARQAPKFSSDDLQTLLQTTESEDKGDLASTSPYVEEQNGFERIVSGQDTLTPEDKARIVQLLGQWEEPTRDGSKRTRKVSVAAVLQFRQALSRTDTYFPFSRSFGIADSRENCVASAQDVFLRLVLQTPESDGLLPFETLAEIAVKRNGQLDMDKVKKLIKVFRPERDGSLSLLDFARSVDAVYKELRLLRAAIDNNSQIDRALENIFNGFFYVALVILIMFFLGWNPLTVFLSFSTVLLSFTFMIGGASASYVEGLLFVLVQRPYNIGDRINVANPQSETPWHGAQNWVVENVSLFTTSIVMGASNERATVANGALAKSRIINWARSTEAFLHFNLRFALDVPYEKIQLFRKTVEKFVQSRPREWLSLLAFRVVKVEPDHGFYEYICFMQHRERWQNIGAVLQSKAVVEQFCLELQRKMNMRYVSPPLPVNLKMTGGSGIASFDPSGSSVNPATNPDNVGMRGPPSTAQQQQQDRPSRQEEELAHFAAIRGPGGSQDLSSSVFALFEGE